MHTIFHLINECWHYTTYPCIYLSLKLKSYIYIYIYQYIPILYLYIYMNISIYIYISHSTYCINISMHIYRLQSLTKTATRRHCLFLLLTSEAPQANGSTCWTCDPHRLWPWVAASSQPGQQLRRHRLVLSGPSRDQSELRRATRHNTIMKTQKCSEPQRPPRNRGPVRNLRGPQLLRSLQGSREGN